MCMPGTLEYRDLAVRAIAAACKLVGKKGPGTPGRPRSAFDDEVVSAFGEAFNNACKHAGHKGSGELEIEIDLGSDSITIRISDYGTGFRMEDVPEPDFESLPESGMGLFIIRSFMDEVSYSAGVPNVLSMTKRIKVASEELPS